MDISAEITKRLFDTANDGTKKGKAVILGFGVSNRPLAKLLASAGANIEVRDAKDDDQLRSFADELSANSAKVILGCEPTESLCDSEDMSNTVIFRSPGIRPDAGEIPEAVKRGALLTSEMDWFCASTAAKIIAITGSDGKTTSTTLTYLLLSEAAKRKKAEGIGSGNVYVGGNIGTPLLDRTDEMTAGDIAVLELSSFQLMGGESKAERAAITNITPNHLNWHTDMGEYTEAKYNIFGKNTKIKVLNAKNPLSAAAAQANSENISSEKIIFFSAYAGSYFECVPPELKAVSDAVFLCNGKIIYSNGSTEEEILNIHDIKLPGTHNIENYMTAIALTRGLVEKCDIVSVAKSFGGVEHRLELVRELDGVKYYNSSIDSTPSRTEAAISVFDCRPVLICGGRDKHVPFDSLAKTLFEKASGVVLTGEAADIIYKAVMSEKEKLGENAYPLAVVRENDFINAIDCARRLAKPGSAVLLSPACTSFDRFKNFEERGRLFKNYVNSLM